MLARVVRLGIAAMGCLMLAGCGGSDLPRPVKVQARLLGPKDLLLKYAESGELDSGTSELQDMLETLKTKDAAKGDELLSDLRTLKLLKDDANAIKAQAQKMLDKL